MTSLVFKKCLNKRILPHVNFPIQRFYNSKFLSPENAAPIDRTTLKNNAMAIGLENITHFEEEYYQPKDINDFLEEDDNVTFTEDSPLYQTMENCYSEHLLAYNEMIKKPELFSTITLESKENGKVLNSLFMNDSRFEISTYPAKVS